ncbi:MAG: TonB family protein [Candidatus Omnitrophica bacterium]|nr:TonB family protein [Candidatus Omnitrophota bacterium]
MKKIIFFICVVFLNIFVLSFIFTQDDEDKTVRQLLLEEDLLEEVEMVIGDVHIFKANFPTRVSVRNPEIVDVKKVDNKEIVLSAKSKGITYFVFWDSQGEHPYRIKVLPEDTEYLNAQVLKILKSLGLPDVYTQVMKEEGKILLLGAVERFEDKERLQNALGELSSRVTDLTTVKAGELVEIVSEVVELRKDSTKTLGVAWPDNISLSEPQNRWATLAGTADAFFRVSNWTRQTFVATLDFLIKEGKARILSRPKVLCESGKEAELFIGGEVPLLQTNLVAGGGNTTNIQYKEYGIKLKIAPVVDERSRIKLNLNIEVSDIGDVETLGTISTSVTSNTTTTTARAYPLTKRNISTQLYLKDGEVLVIGGLIKQKSNETLKKFPWLADVPILGTFFRHKSVTTGGGNPKLEDTELFITLTPRIVATKERLIDKEKKQMQKKEEFPTLYRNETLPIELQDYLLLVQQKISENIVYPASLVGTGWEGTVLVRLKIASNGWLEDAQILKSSGYKIFDEEALKLVKSLSYPAFPASVDLKEVKIEVPIVYKQAKK